MAATSRKSSSFNTKKIVLAALLLGIVWGAYRFYPRQQNIAEIFVVEPFSYGETTLAGVVQKDSALGDSGAYFLVTPGGRNILLDADGIDAMVGQEVTVTGLLLPTEDESGVPVFTINSMETL